MVRILKTARNALIRFLVLLAVFLGAVFIFARAMNQMTPNTSGEMAGATFPLVYMQDNGVSYNCLHGYSYEMDVNEIRDTLTILNSDHELDILIQPFETNIANVSYEVLTLDGDTSLENTSVINLIEDEKNCYNATLTLQNQMLLNQEYILKIQMTAGERDVYYYTRLLLEDGLHLDSYLDFVTGFYEKCINKTDQASLGLVVEPDETTEQNQSLAAMDLHDTVAQLMWGSLNPQINYKPTPSLVDINGTTASFVLEYRISAVDEDDVTNVYNVKEFYRLRYTDSRVFLLDFTRTTEEVMNTERKVLEETGINLGITGQDVEYLFSDEKNAIAFVEGDELWSYVIGTDTLTRIFSFAPETEVDYRDFYGHNNINILSVNEIGDVWYLVSGYMNRGDHEGENGIALYHYEEASSSSEELMFIKSMESYDALKLDLDTLSYLTANGKYCYLYLEDIVYRINMETGDYEEFITGIKNGCSTSSETGRYFSWLSDDRYDSKTLNTIDFETGQTREVSCGDDERIRQVCYMDDDLVYGIAKESDIVLGSDGIELFPMETLVIVDENGETLKTYSYSGIYVTEVEPSESMLTLTRVIKSGDEYAEAAQDTIVSTNTEENVEYGISTEMDDINQAEVILRVGKTGSEETQQMVSGKFSNENEPLQITIPTNPDVEKLYYVYAGGSLESRWPTATEAIWRADEKVGVVINDEKEYVWERGNKEDEAEIKIDKIPDIVKTGTMNIDMLEEGLGKVVVDLTGCTLDQVLYFVSEGKPVIGDTAEGSVIITGYDDFGNLILLNPGEDETYFYGPNDSLEMFEARGNRFISYLNTDLE